MRRFEIKNPDIEWDDLRNSLLRLNTVFIDGVEYYVTSLKFTIFTDDITAEFTEKS